MIHRVLSIFNSKKTIIIVSRLLKLLCVTICFIGFAKLLRYVLNDDTKSYTRLTFHQMYNPAHNIDVAFVGSSHCYRSFIPDIYDDCLEKYSFNAGTSSQHLDDSYEIIKELCSHNNVEQIFLELYCGSAESVEPYERTQLTSTYIVSDYLKPSFHKFSYILRASSKDYWVDSFIIGRRNWKHLLDFNYMKNLVIKKQNPNYKNYKWEKKEKDTEWYHDRGFVANNQLITPDDIKSDEIVRIEKSLQLTKENYWYKYLHKIVNYCKRKNVKLTLIVAPEPDIAIKIRGNYQEYIDFVNELADIYDVPYYDFNLCKNEYFDSSNYSLFKDKDHLNLNGASIFTSVFSNFISGKITKEELFYNNLSEKYNYLK